MAQCGINIKLFNNLPIKVIENRYEGGFNRLNWTDIEKVSALIQLSLEVLYLEAEINTPIYINKVSDDYLELGFDVEIENVDLDPALLNQIVFYLLSSVTNEGDNRDLFRDFNQIDEAIKDALRPLIINFIEKNKGKHIQQRIEINVAGEKFVLSGQYKRNISDVIYLEPTSKIGKIDGLIISKTKLNIIIDNKTNLVAYYDFERFFYDLHKFLGSPQKINFKLQPITNKNNKTDLYISDFHPIEETYDENELNFNEKI